MRSCIIPAAAIKGTKASVSKVSSHPNAKAIPIAVPEQKSVAEFLSTSFCIRGNRFCLMLELGSQNNAKTFV